MSRILGWEGAYPSISGLFLKAVVQAVLLFGSDTCVLTPYKAGLGQISAQICVADHWEASMASGGGVGGCKYPPLEPTMKEAGFGGIRAYITKRQNMVVQYIVARLILDLCEQSV